MPHITEELYQTFFKKEKSVHVSSWPEHDKTLVNADAEAAGEVLVFAIERARRAKSEQNLSLKAPLKSLVVRAKISKEQFNTIEADLKAATEAQSVSFAPLSKDAEEDMECDILL